MQSTDASLIISLAKFSWINLNLLLFRKNWERAPWEDKSYFQAQILSIVVFVCGLFLFSPTRKMHYYFFKTLNHATLPQQNVFTSIMPHTWQAFGSGKYSYVKTSVKDPEEESWREIRGGGCPRTTCQWLMEIPDCFGVCCGVRNVLWTACAIPFTVKLRGLLTQAGTHLNCKSPLTVIHILFPEFSRVLHIFLS